MRLGEPSRGALTGHRSATPRRRSFAWCTTQSRWRSRRTTRACAGHDMGARARTGMSLARFSCMQGSLVGLFQVRHQPAWKQWQELTADAPPFLGPEFFTLAAPLTEGSDPFVASAWDGDTMIGALPLVRDHHRLRALRCDYTLGYDYFGHADRGNAALRAGLYLPRAARRQRVRPRPVRHLRPRDRVAGAPGHAVLHQVSDRRRR